MYVILFICGIVCSCSCVFLQCVPRLSGQVTHPGDPFSASPDPRPQPLCLLRMCPLGLVPYPIILCPCSKNPCSPIVLLTCSTLPIVCNTPCCLPSRLANFSTFFFPICSSGLLHFYLATHSLSLQSPAFYSIHFGLTLNTYLHLCIFALYVIYIISSSLIFSNFLSISFFLPNTDGLMQEGPTSLKTGNTENVLLSASAAHLAPLPHHHHTLIPPSVPGLAWAGELLPPLGPRENLVELNCNNFSFSLCSCGLLWFCPVLLFTTTHTDVHMPGLVI